MYRFIFPLLLCVNVVTPAPQSKSDSEVNFVKIQPVLEDTAPEVTNVRQESRIENLPLTIPGSLGDTPSEGTVPNDRLTDDIVSDDKPTDFTVPDAKPTYDPVSDTLPDLTVQNTEVSEQKTDAETENRFEISQESQARQGRNFHSSDETTESFEIATEKYEDVTEIVIKPPKFPPKLSYFPKNNDRFSTNLIEKSGKRQFRSRCRCEKIWNCPKLQISVPRCPDEYFLCCF